MKSKINYLINNIFIISLFNKGIGFLSILVMYKFFDKDVVGEFNMYIVYISLFASIVTLGSEQSLLKKLIHKDTILLDESFTSYTILISFICILVVPLMIIQNIDYLFILMYIIIVSYLIIEKYFEMYAKYKNKYKEFLKVQGMLMFTSLLFYSLYPILFVAYQIQYLISIKFVLLVSILIVTNKNMINSFKHFDPTYIVNKMVNTIATDKQFIMLLVVSTVVVYSDKVIVSYLISYEEFADFTLLMTFVGIIYSIKVLFSNKYIYLIAKTSFYYKKVRFDSLIYTIIIGFIMLIVYFCLTKFFLLNYTFMYEPFIIAFIFIIIENLFGSSGPIITYMHKPIINVYFEFISLAFIGILLLLYITILNKYITIVPYFVTVIFFTRSFIAFLKLSYIKKKKIINLKNDNNNRERII